MTGRMDERLSAVTDQLAGAVRDQYEDRDPAHEDFSTWGWALTELLDRADQVMSVLERQVGHYGDRRILRDDHGADPTARLAEITACLSATRTALGPARDRVREYHSAVSHIGVEVDPEATP